MRSGGTEHKLNALLNGISVLNHVVRRATATGLPFHVVRPEAGAQSDGAGMGDSIARGVRATAHANGWLILPGDLPLVQPDSILRVAQALVTATVVLPFWEGQQGHPVGFSADCGSDLMALTGDTGAASVVRMQRRVGLVRELHLDDPGIALDIDTVEDLKLLQATRLG